MGIPANVRILKARLHEIEAKMRKSAQDVEATQNDVEELEPIIETHSEETPASRHMSAGHHDAVYEDFDEESEPSSPRLTAAQKGKGRAADYEKPMSRDSDSDEESEMTVPMLVAAQKRKMKAAEYEAANRDASTQSNVDPNELGQPDLTRGMSATGGTSLSRFKESAKVNPGRYRGERGGQSSQNIFGVLGSGTDIDEDDRTKNFTADGNRRLVEEEDSRGQPKQGHTERRKGIPAIPNTEEDDSDDPDLQGHAKPKSAGMKGPRPTTKPSSTDNPFTTASSSATLVIAPSSSRDVGGIASSTAAPVTTPSSSGNVGVTASSNRSPSVQAESSPSLGIEDENRTYSSSSGFFIRGRAAQDAMSQNAESDDTRARAQTGEVLSTYEAEVTPSSREQPGAQSNSPQPPRPASSQQANEGQTSLAPPPAPTPAHAVLPSNSAPQSSESEALTRARAQATRYHPKQPSGLRAASRLSTSTVAEEPSSPLSEVSGNEFAIAILDAIESWKGQKEGGIGGLPGSSQEITFFGLDGLENGSEVESGAQALPMFEDGLS